eukprot:CAMPEP_0117058834 /NCGR_PEP_ID=MMETSP0472-20121206/40860_1 /TAXON_ID=693140 ORGANISM="Tiarina fusus, Strain LIS" /NCGR_SAMPLE_ID=MMETSP0472 /ASSEMBLY_ACC=CAM_ASM_000603 /LENGTH=211 /DNA_ID=CAMNT_0004776291 /DNA_START=10 /DNA_END=643 /DNA_ORIENTATION=-
MARLLPLAAVGLTVVCLVGLVGLHVTMEVPELELGQSSGLGIGADLRKTTATLNRVRGLKKVLFKKIDKSTSVVVVKSKKTGKPGLPGVRGPRGNRGRPGRSGPQGMQGKRGPRGIPGIRGHKGQKGLPGGAGRPGAMGRPGIQDNLAQKVIKVPRDAAARWALAAQEDQSVHVVHQGTRVPEVLRDHWDLAEVPDRLAGGEVTVTEDKQT